MTSSAWRWGTPVLISFLLGSVPVAAEPFVESFAEAEASESGLDGGFDTDTDVSTTSGGAAVAEAFRCLGTALCSFQPGQLPPHGGRGAATTSYGSNRASSYAAEGAASDDDSVFNSASASSFWVDEWTFDVAGSAVGDPVLLEFHIDGSWGNNGEARFMAAVGQRIVPAPEPDPEAPPSFLLPDVENVTGVVFSTESPFVIVGIGPTTVLIPNPDGGEPAGSIDIVVTVSFVPVPGETYVVQSRLTVQSPGSYNGGAVTASFDSTAELVRVVVPDGVSFASAAGADYDVEVPEPASALLVWLGVGALALSRARMRRISH